MRKLKRPKIIKEFLEAQIEKNQRRIQTIAENTYKLRQQLQVLEAIEAAQKKALAPAIEALATEQPKAETEMVTDSADQEIGTPTEQEESQNAK